MSFRQKLRNCKIVIPAVSNSSIHPKLYAEWGMGEGNGPLQGFVVVPLRGLSRHFLSMALQLGQVVEGVMELASHNCRPSVCLN